MGGAQSSNTGTDTRQVVKMTDPDVCNILCPIMKEFVTIFCIVDPKHHVMLNEFVSAFVYYADKKVCIGSSSRHKLYVTIAALLNVVVPDSNVKGFSMYGGLGIEHALTGITLARYP
jgi:hypothetical protein